MRGCLGIVLIKLAVLFTGIITVALIFPGIKVSSMAAAVFAAFVLGVLNLFIKPVLLILLFPINLITLGLFTFVINALLLWLTGRVAGGFEVAGFLNALGGAAVISLISASVDAFMQSGKDKDNDN